LRKEWRARPEVSPELNKTKQNKTKNKKISLILALMWRRLAQGKTEVVG
jgi:hypothetical protein